MCLPFQPCCGVSYARPALSCATGYAPGFAVVVLLAPRASSMLTVPLARAGVVAATGSVHTFVAAPLVCTHPSAAATQPALATVEDLL